MIWTLITVALIIIGIVILLLDDMCNDLLFGFTEVYRNGGNA